MHEMVEGTAKVRLEPRERSRAHRRLISADDLHFMMLAPFLMASAIALPQCRWPSAANRIQRLADAMRPQKAVTPLDAAAATMKVDLTQLEEWIRASRVGRTEHLIHCFRALFQPTWAVPIRIEGRQYLDQALAEGKGAVIWVGHFCFASLFTKMALYHSDYAVSHISRPEHGVSKSRMGLAVLNRSRCVPENRYLRERIVHDRSSPVDTKARALAALSRNRIVSVTVGAWEGRRVAVGPLLGAEFEVAVGAPSLAFTSGAALLPVFTTRLPDGDYCVDIKPPISVVVHEAADDYAVKAAEVLLDHLDGTVRTAPEQWRGWKDWLALRRVARDRLRPAATQS